MSSHYFPYCAHGTSANVVLAIVACGWAYMYALDEGPPGVPLCWDYQASTDNADDPDLKIACACNGKATWIEVKASGGFCFDLRKCPKNITELVV